MIRGLQQLTEKSTYRVRIAGKPQLQAVKHQ
jgi:hypothetical protein